MRGMMAEYYRRQAQERSGDAMRRTIERGVPMLRVPPPGYFRGEDGRLVIDPVEGPVMAQAFQMRADGREIREIKAMMADHGIKRAWSSIRKMLMSKVYLGQIAFGELVNESAHEPLVDEATWRQCQRRKPTPGRRAKSDLLLARLGVLRCASCGAAMIASRQKSRGRYYAYYKCPQSNDCTAKATISQKIVEPVVIGHVRSALADLQGHASADDHVRDAEKELATAQQALERRHRGFRRDQRSIGQPETPGPYSGPQRRPGRPRPDRGDPGERH